MFNGCRSKYKVYVASYISWITAGMSQLIRRILKDSGRNQKFKNWVFGQAQYKRFI